MMSQCTLLVNIQKINSKLTAKNPTWTDQENITQLSI